MIIVRTPLRISFAGGGTDIPEYYRHDFGSVCSMAINKYIYVTVNNLSSFFPHRFRIAYSKTELVQDAESIVHPIVRTALLDRKLHGGIDINVMADVPAGTGMGSSSAFSVGLSHALNALQGRISSKEEIAREACRIEIDLLKEPIGKQDHYASAFGGLNLLSFFKDEQVRVEPLPVAEAARKTLVGNLMLFYLGSSREASRILQRQSSNVELRRAELDEIRAQASEAAKILTGNGPLDDLGHLLRRGWELKKKLASGITNLQIDYMMDKAQEAGALGGKLLGAGGTGFLLFYVTPEHQPAVRAAMEGLHEIDFEIDTLGSTLLYYGE